MANFCPNCGKEIKSGENFCMNCGTNIGQQTVTPTNRFQHPEQQRVYVRPWIKLSSAWIYILIILGIISAIAFILYGLLVIL